MSRIVLRLGDADVSVSNPLPVTGGGGGGSPFGIANTAWTDGTNFYVRREIDNNGTFTISWENLDGTAATPTVANLKLVSNAVQPVSQSGAWTTTPASQGYKSAVSVTRTADTNAYTANDVIGPATGSTAAMSFATSGPSGGGELFLTSAELEIDASAIISGETSYNLYLYSVTPPSALGDNAAFDIPSGDRASFIGKVSLGTPVDEGSTLYVRSDSINAQFSAASGTIYGYLVTVGAYTPTSARVYKVTLHFTAL